MDAVVYKSKVRSGHLMVRMYYAVVGYIKESDAPIGLNRANLALFFNATYQ